MTIFSANEALHDSIQLFFYGVLQLEVEIM